MYYNILCNTLKYIYYIYCTILKYLLQYLLYYIILKYLLQTCMKLLMWYFKRTHNLLCDYNSLSKLTEFKRTMDDNYEYLNLPPQRQIPKILNRNNNNIILNLIIIIIINNI